MFPPPFSLIPTPEEFLCNGWSEVRRGRGEKRRSKWDPFPLGKEPFLEIADPPFIAFSNDYLASMTEGGVRAAGEREDE